MTKKVTSGNSVSVTNSPNAIVAGGNVQVGTQPSATTISAKPTDLRIFISYRREDSTSISGRLADTLLHYYGEKAVFKDVYSIDGGAVFSSALETAIRKTDVFLALIGDCWNRMSNDGQRRLDNENDWIRREIELALGLNVPVIPILTADTELPQRTHLPQSIQPLLDRQIVRLREDPDFRQDVSRLISSIDALR